MVNPFAPRVSFLVTMIAAAVFYFGVDVTDWSEIVAIFVIWLCGMISGLLDAEFLDD